MDPNTRAELKSRLDLILKYKSNRRIQEEIIGDIISLIKNTKQETFIPYLLQMINAIHLRHSSEAFRNLMSPLQQLAYLIDIYFSAEHEQIKHGPTEEEWLKITELLMEVEMTYFGEIGFFDEASGGFELNKISVSLKTFFDYYSNAQLSFDEQTLSRLKLNFERFDEDIFKEYGFRTNDIIIFCSHLNDLVHEKGNKSLYYAQRPEEWEKLTSSFIERGLSDPRQWAEEPELADMIGFMKMPGYFFIQNKSQIYSPKLDDIITDNLLSFLRYDGHILKNKTVYYDDLRQFFQTPIIELNDHEFLCPNFKFLIEAFYNRINSRLSELRREKYIQFKNKMLEGKTSEIFEKFFGEEAKIFTSFYFDEVTKSEQDLAVLYKGNLLIVEVKDFKFRAPLRNPMKAFDRIKSDFKSGIQKAYQQCKRLEDKIETGVDFKIFDKKTNKELFTIRPSKLKNYYSIIVTQHKYGAIQTNLESLLKKETDTLYPWSVCIDDLEIFTLGLKKIKKGLGKSLFLDYLEYREYFHERLICSDELELCGYFINSPTDFKKMALMEEVFTTDTRMSEIFDAHYKNGLGFENEINIDQKRKNPIGEYAKSFSADVIIGKELMGKGL